MSDDVAKIVAEVLRRIATLIDQMNATDLRELVDGKTSLLVGTLATGTAGPLAARESPVPKGRAADRGTGRRPSARVTASEAADAHAALSAMSSRAEARAYLAEFGTVPRLRSLADALDVPLASKETRDTLVGKLVDGTVGAKLTASAMQGRASSPLV